MADDPNFYDGEQVLTFLADQLAKAPLYAEVCYSDQSGTTTLPQTVCLFCETCDKETNWEAWATGANYRTGFGAKEYTCRNCKKGKITYHFYWGINTGGNIVLFFKIGQWPALEERIPTALQQSLDRSSLTLYYKALRCRNQNLGLGSLTYLRRVVEDKINLVLDMIAEEAKGIGFAPEHVAKLEGIKGKGLFKDKIELASAILPPSLRPGGHNPINALHDLSSDGIHRRSEEECIQLFDRVRAVFEYLFREIDTRRRSATEYAASVAKLASQHK